MSAFLSIEGIDGSGKTTQVERLASRLRRRLPRVLVSREPGGSPLGEDLRALLLGFTDPISPRAEALLLAAARAEHVASTILPALQEGAVVIVDRFVDSSLAYQGCGLQLGIDDVLAINRFALATVSPPRLSLGELPVCGQGQDRGFQEQPECWPDLTVLLDVPVPVAVERQRRAGRSVDRVESRGPQYWERVRAGYLRLAQRWPDRIRVVPATAAPEQVEAAVWEIVRQRWPEWASPAADGAARGEEHHEADALHHPGPGQFSSS